MAPEDGDRCVRGASDMPAELLRAFHRGMLRVRLFEERVAELLEAGEIRCPTHLCIGQEAVAVGVCAALRRDDYVFGNHRSHGHYLAKGGDMAALMAELYCKASGCARGRGGSMHLYAGEVGLLGTVPMVGATIPIAVGAALASVMEGRDRVAVAFFGDGATEEGVFHEALNFAALKRLPVLFVCENNFYSSHLPLHQRRPADALHRLAEPYGVPSLRLDGNDVEKVYAAASDAVARARAGEGPTFLECRTYRWRGHVGPRWDLDKGIRSEEEVRAWMAKCPIQRLETRLLEAGFMSHEELAKTRAEVAAEVEAAVGFARESPYPPGERMGRHLFV